MNLPNIHLFCHETQNKQQHPKTDPNYFDLLKKDGTISNITLDCITNLTNINNRFYEILNDFKQVNIDVSIDSYDLSNDYIRYPSKFNKIEEGQSDERDYVKIVSTDENNQNWNIG